MRKRSSIFSRLVYLSSLREASTGRYLLASLAAECGQEEVDRALRATHEQIFGEWLEFRLEEQYADLRLYLSGLADDTGQTISSWRQREWYRNLPPDTAKPADRGLFISDLEAILVVLDNEHQEQ